MTQTTDRRDEIFMQIISDPHVDPRPLYQQLREISPVYRTPFGMWWVLDYDVARALMADKATWTVDAAASATGGVQNADRFAMQTWSRSLIVVDGDVHSRMHAIVKDVFKPAAIRRTRAVVEATVERQFAELGDRSEFDLRWDVAEHLPTRVILDVLGIDTAHLELFSQVAESLSQIMEPTATEETLEWGDRVWREAAEVVERSADERLVEPRDDLLTALVLAESDGERLSRPELVSMVLLLAVAGQETTGQMICSGLYHMLEHPEQLAALRADRSLMGRAIEECLRFDTPVRVGGPRFCRVDTELGGVVIPAGEMVMPCLSAVNMDPKAFDDPMRFDIHRPPTRHMAFGTGHHHCLGSALARMELEVVWTAMIDSYAVIEADHDLAWKARFMVRGLESMPLRVRSAAAVGA